MKLEGAAFRFSSNRNAVTTSSPGLPLRLPWVQVSWIPQPQSGCAFFRLALTVRRNRFAVE